MGDPIFRLKKIKGQVGGAQEFPLKRETPSFLLMINLNKVQIYQLRERAALLPLNKPPSLIRNTYPTYLSTISLTLKHSLGSPLPSKVLLKLSKFLLSVSEGLGTIAN